MAQDRIEKWVRRVLTDPMILRTESEQPRKCVMLALMHVTSGINNEVQSHKLGSKQWDPKQLADMFNGIADEHAAGLASSESGSGQEAYKLVAFYDDQPELPQCPLPIMRRTGAMAFADDPIVTEPPTPRGQIAQSMRLQDAWMQFVLEKDSRMTSGLLGIIDRMSSRLATVEKENQDTFELAKEMILEKAADAHEHKMTELKFERASEERKRLMAAAPALVNQLFSKEIFPASHVDSGLIEELMGSLDESTIAKLTELIVPKLKPETAALLIGRFTQVVEAQNAKKRENAEMVKHTKGNGVKS